MQTIADYLFEIFNFFTSNWIAAGVLALVVVVAAIKKAEGTVQGYRPDSANIGRFLHDDVSGKIDVLRSFFRQEGVR